jgi:DNA polymerase-3 subunit delta
MSAPSLQSLIKRWPDDLRLVLLHGYDQGLCLDSADILTRAHTDPANPAGLERLTADQLLQDPQALATAVSERSMFGDRVLVRVDGVDDRAAAALRLMLDGPAGNPLLLVANRLKATGALLSLLASDAQTLAIELKSLNAGQLLDAVKDMASALDMRCDRQAAQLLVDATGGERSLLRRELEKLALYLDANAAHPPALTAEDVAAVAAGTDFFDHAALATAAVAGRSSEVVTRLAQMPSGEGVVALRFLAARLATLAELCARVEAGLSPVAAVDGHRPPVFFKEKPAIVEAVKRWSSRRVAAALRAVLAAEIALKSSGGLADLDAQAMVLRIGSHR